MILIPILTLIWAGSALSSIYGQREPDSYDNWLSEPNDLEIV